MKNLFYTITQTDKGISALDIVHKTSTLQTIDFSKPETYTLDLQGTPFQKQVWKALTKIQKGKTKTYSEVAQMIGKPTAVRAVASAIARNTIAILIPCHRVIRSDGTLGEYRWGKELKKKLLQNEQNNV
jgi:O-6-methylguanine DNA methyltransferase